MSIAKLCQPFLVTFQADAPLVAFLHNELLKMMNSWHCVKYKEYALSQHHWRQCVHTPMWTFLPTRRYASAVFATFRKSAITQLICLSDHPSCNDIVSKQRKLASWFLHHLVAPRLYFYDAKFHNQMGSPRTGPQRRVGCEKSAIL